MGKQHIFNQNTWHAKQRIQSMIMHEVMRTQQQVVQHQIARGKSAFSFLEFCFELFVLELFVECMLHFHYRDRKGLKKTLLTAGIFLLLTLISIIFLPIPYFPIHSPFYILGQQQPSYPKSYPNLITTAVMQIMPATLMLIGMFILVKRGITVTRIFAKKK